MAIPVVMHNPQGASKVIGVGSFDKHDGSFNIRITNSRLLDFLNKGLKDGPKSISIQSIAGSASAEAGQYQIDDAWWDE